MNKKNVTSIEVSGGGVMPQKRVYKVEYFRRINDLRSPIKDRRGMGKEIGDGWSDMIVNRDILNEHVDDFIEYLDRVGFEYELKFDK